MKSLYSYIILVFLALLLFTEKSSAQDTMRIDVVKPFIATLSDAMKIQSNPNPEVPVVVKDTFTYASPEVLYDDVPTGYTIKPLSLGTSLLPKLKNNYTKIGYGNYNTPLVELYLNTTRNRNYQAGLFVKHLSSSTDDKRYFSNNTASVYGKRFVSKGIVEGDFMYNRNVVNLYGYAYPNGNYTHVLDAPAPPETENRFTLYELKGGYSNVLKDTSKLGYQVQVRYYHYDASYGLKENDFLLSTKFHKSVQGNPLDVYAAVQTSGISSSVTDYSRVFVDINPTYRLLIDRAYVTLGFNSTFFNDSVGTKFYFFPKAELGYKLIPNALTAFGGFRGDLQRHTLRSVATENPFIRGINFENTQNMFDLYAGLKGMVSAQTSFLLEASFASVKNLMFYVADSGLYSQRTFYDGSKAGLTRIKAELNHEFSEQFRFGFVMNYFGYDLSVSAPYSRPTFTTSWNIMYNMGNKFYIRSEVYTMNERKVRELPSNRDVTMKGLVDLNVGLDYRYNKNVKLFLNVNNLTNNQYQRWLNLPVLGINVIGGLGITF